MSMSKKDFIALANVVIERRSYLSADNKSLGFTKQAEQSAINELAGLDVFTTMLANFCQSQNPRFDRERWLAYIAGECGPNGGKR